MAVEVAPLRSLHDFLTDAQFTAPTLHDRERMDNRMINNLIYYQTNYFLSAIIIFILVGTLYPKDLIIGSFTLVCTFVLFGIAQSREQRIAKLKSEYPSLVPITVIAVAVLIIYALGSILVFIWGVTVPLAVILLHAATRKRNIKNKFANVVEVFKEDVSPMTIILSKICTMEQEQQDSGNHQN